MISIKKKTCCNERVNRKVKQNRKRKVSCRRKFHFVQAREETKNKCESGVLNLLNLTVKSQNFEEFKVFFSLFEYLYQKQERLMPNRLINAALKKGKLKWNIDLLTFSCI